MISQMKDKTLLEFGFGDIHGFHCANGGVGIATFRNGEPLKIGLQTPLHFDSIEEMEDYINDAQTVCIFNNVASVVSVINQLSSLKSRMIQRTFTGPFE